MTASLFPGFEEHRVQTQGAEIFVRKSGNCPVLVLSGSSGIAAIGAMPVELWKIWAEDVRGQSFECGHFLPEEKPDETALALLEFFKPHG